MAQNPDVRTADWTCPSTERRKIIERPDPAFLEDVEYVEKTMTGVDSSACILPLWQNLEALVLERRILGEGRKLSLSEYCITDLSDIRDLDFDLLSDPMIQTVIQTISRNKEKALILEVEAPFSVLAGLMNPMDLYLCFEDQGDLLTDLLYRIADASAAYIKACVDAGCRIISLADPTGTMNLVGEDYYKRYCGRSGLYLMRKCNSFLDQAIMHICLKMSRSLLIGDLVEVYPYEVDGKFNDYVDILSSMAEDPVIHFTGMTCIHNEKPDLKKSWGIGIKERGKPGKKEYRL